MQDCFGTPVFVGDKILYAASSYGKGVTMVIGEVIRVTEARATIREISTIGPGRGSERVCRPERTYNLTASGPR